MPIPILFNVMANLATSHSSDKKSKHPKEGMLTGLLNGATSFRTRYHQPCGKDSDERLSLSIRGGAPRICR